MRQNQVPCVTVKQNQPRRGIDLLRFGGSSNSILTQDIVEHDGHRALSVFLPFSSRHTDERLVGWIIDHPNVSILTHQGGRYCGQGCPLQGSKGCMILVFLKAGERVEAEASDDTLFELTYHGDDRFTFIHAPRSFFAHP